MANDMNVVALVGRLTRDSELRYTQGGMAIARFSIAVNRRKRTADNRWEDEANFFDCAMFGKSAESVNQYLERGRQVSVIGELRQNRWEQDGQSRSKVEIIVNSLQLLASAGGGQGGRSDAQAYNQAPARQQEAPPIEYGGPEQFDDDQIPF